MFRRLLKDIPWALLLLGLPVSAQLDLPDRPSGQPASPPQAPRSGSGGEPEVRDGSQPVVLPGAPAPVFLPDDLGPMATARAIFTRLSSSREASSAGPALEQLLALGPSVLPSARAQLASESVPTLLAAGRLCLVGGSSEDRSAVAQRLTRRLPPECAAPLLEELLLRDPMLSPPDYLASLLAHPTPAMRVAARRALEKRVTVAHLPALAPLLASELTAARSAALDLVARVEDPQAWNLLASRLGDPNARLARRAATLLAALESTEALLLQRAFPADQGGFEASWDRARAHAVLALVLREEARQEVLLSQGHIPSLLEGLGSVQPLVAGACAVALARVGFRVGAARAGSWLDRDVPHQLIRSATGAEFHSDFSTLEQPSQRALALLTGESFGPDGGAWRRWWLARAEGFRARHGVIELAPGDEARLEITFEDERGRSWRLVGPEFPPSALADGTLYLDERDALRVSELLADEDIFGMERLPGGSRFGGESELCVTVGAQEKRFAYRRGTLEWFDRLLGALEAVASEHRWQVYADAALRSTQADWRVEQERWASLPPRERELELKRLLIAALRRVAAGDRDAPLEDLRLLYARPGLAEGADFEPLLAVLAGESSFGPRAEELFEMVRISAGSEDLAAPDGGPRERLLALGIEHFGPEADVTLARVALDLGPEALRRLALDPRTRARALAAAGLVRTGDEHALLRGLFFDTSSLVRRAVLEALEHAREDLLREELIECARSQAPALRILALKALAQRGGKDVRDLAMEALGDEDPALNLAGVRTLAELAAPESASLFASLLARGSSSPLYAPARRGLVRMGEVGMEECLRMAKTAGQRARREAILLLSESLRAEAAPLLLDLLHADPRDGRVIWELSVLSGQDLAALEDPVEGAWIWWDLVVRDDPLAWLLASAERAGVAAPARVAFEGSGTREGALFLLEVCKSPFPFLVERATRELERLLAAEFERPATGEQWAAFREELGEAVQARFGE